MNIEEIKLANKLLKDIKDLSECIRLLHADYSTLTIFNGAEKFEIKHEDYNVYVSSSTETVVASDFVVTDIQIDGKIDPLNVSTIVPHIKWKRFVPEGKSVNYISKFHWKTDVLERRLAAAVRTCGAPRVMRQRRTKIFMVD